MQESSNNNNFGFQTRGQWRTQDFSSPFGEYPTMRKEDPTYFLSDLSETCMKIEKFYAHPDWGTLLLTD